MTEPDFRKTFFSGRKCRKYAGKTGFLAFPQDFIISFYWFFVQKCVIAIVNMWPSPIFKKNFFPAENTGNRRFCTFSLDLFYIVLVFSHNIVNSNSQCFVKIAGTAGYRAGKTSFLQFLESWISALFFRLIFHSFAIVRSFVFQYLSH